MAAFDVIYLVSLDGRVAFIDSPDGNVAQNRF